MGRLVQHGTGRMRKASLGPVTDWRVILEPRTAERSGVHRQPPVVQPYRARDMGMAAQEQSLRKAVTACPAIRSGGI